MAEKQLFRERITRAAVSNLASACREAEQVVQDIPNRFLEAHRQREKATMKKGQKDEHSELKMKSKMELLESQLLEERKKNQHLKAITKEQKHEISTLRNMIIDLGNRFRSLRMVVSGIGAEVDTVLSEVKGEGSIPLSIEEDLKLRMLELELSSEGPSTPEHSTHENTEKDIELSQEAIQVISMMSPEELAVLDDMEFALLSEN